ncbi:GNAT family N-acetyltransferase [Cohnella candidum]|uniref:GNAT family N-acetyltransferase n=1 Tax=Cohnella candidum TaxID=2674991 RepID=A0A3G3JW79_9BACL|nr:GNAT family N-acetyltransferase [Cohnella candidum]AYQ72488.1 GNAT family N-acetyltransferase [Cohnella candidum]
MQIIQTSESEVVAHLNKEVHDLHVSLYPAYFKEYHFETVNEFFKNAMTNPRFLFYIIKDEDQYLGYAWIELREYTENVFMRAYKSIFVHQLCISKRYQSRGLGSLLINKIDQIAKENGINKIELDFWADNKIAEQFYLKNGFKDYRRFVYRDHH